MTKTQSKANNVAPVSPLFYKKVVPLNKEVHGNLYLEATEGYQNTKKTSSVYIAAVEFLAAAREYPIVFAKGKGQQYIFPVVLLGLEQDKNLFVNEKGEWQADYIPAYVRRYPFILATPDDESVFTVCIDEGYPGFNTAKEGKPLFDEKGKQLDILNQAVDFLKDYQSHIKMTTLFCENLFKLNLLEPMQANIEMASGAKHALGGFMGVDRKKLKALKLPKLLEMFESDQLELIFAHLASLTNVNGLLKRLA